MPHHLLNLRAELVDGVRLLGTQVVGVEFCNPERIRPTALELRPVVQQCGQWAGLCQRLCCGHVDLLLPGFLSSLARVIHAFERLEQRWRIEWFPLFGLVGSHRGLAVVSVSP
eukprot:3936111-Rhodomonas_salina.1